MTVKTSVEVLVEVVVELLHVPVKILVKAPEMSEVFVKVAVKVSEEVSVKVFVAAVKISRIEPESRKCMPKSPWKCLLKSLLNSLNTCQNSQHQLLVLVFLKEYISKDDRDFLELIDLMSDIKEKLDLDKIPYFTTLQKFVSNTIKGI